MSSIENTFILETLHKFSNLTYVTIVEFENEFARSENEENISEIIYSTMYSYDIKIFYLLKLPDCPLKINVTRSWHLYSRFVAQLAGLVILQTGYYSTNKMKLISDTVCSSFSPLTRKNVDIYIFQTRLPKNRTPLRSLLLHDSFLNSIRFKIILYSIESKVMVSINFLFCPLNIKSTENIITVWELSSKKAAKKILETVSFDDNCHLVNMNGKLLRIAVPIMGSEIETFRHISVHNAKRGPWKYLIEEYLTVNFFLALRSQTNLSIQQK